MKQHITKEQWNEIDINKIKFINSIDNICLEVKTSCIDDIITEASKNLESFRPSIGQMLEFLGDDLLKIENNVQYVIVKIFEKEGKRSLVGCLLKKGKFEEEELVDALWEAVKYKLNYENS